MLLIQMLGHMCHILQVIVKSILSDTRVFIVLLFLQTVLHQLISMCCERPIQLFPHLILLFLEITSGLLLENSNLFLEVIDQLVNLINCFLLRWPLRTILYETIGVLRVRASNICGVDWTFTLFDSNDLLHLFLILTLVPCALKWLLTDPIDFFLHILDHLAILLLSEYVVLLLGNLGFLQLLSMLVLFKVDLVILLVQVWPVLGGNLKCYNNRIYRQASVKGCNKLDLLRSFPSIDPCFLYSLSSAICSHLLMKFCALRAPTSSSCLIPARIFEAFFGNSVIKLTIVTVYQVTTYNRWCQEWCRRSSGPTSSFFPWLHLCQLPIRQTRTSRSAIVKMLSVHLKTTHWIKIHC